MAQPVASVVTPRRSRGVLAAVAVAVTVGLLLLPGCGSKAEATTFQRQAVTTPTADPFMAGVGTDQTGVKPPANASGPYPGTTPGLYGGTGDDAVCDPAALVAFLNANPEKATAWAGVLGIEPSEVAAFVAKLTPVVLRTDTAVTNHGFKDGKATSIPAVLQAGTAVMVNDLGVPVVKCNCGDPLTPPDSIENASYDGSSWNGFASDAVTTVTPAAAPVPDLVIADPRGAGVRRPVGTTGPADTPFVPDDGVPTGPTTPSTPRPQMPLPVVERLLPPT